MTNPWNRRSNEPDSAWEAFELYCTMGPGARSNANVGRTLGKSKALADRWSSKWGWVERARAYDMHMADVVQKRLEAEMGEMAVRHVKLGKNLQAVSGVVLQEWARRIQEGEVDLKDVPVQVLSKITRDSALTAKTGVEIERLAVGESTEKVEHTGEATINVRLWRPDEEAKA